MSSRQSRTLGSTRSWLALAICSLAIFCFNVACEMKREEDVTILFRDYIPEGAAVYVHPGGGLSADAEAEDVSWIVTLALIDGNVVHELGLRVEQPEATTTEDLFCVLLELREEFERRLPPGERVRIYLAGPHIDQDVIVEPLVVDPLDE